MATLHKKQFIQRILGAVSYGLDYKGLALFLVAGHIIHSLDLHQLWPPQKPQLIYQLHFMILLRLPYQGKYRPALSFLYSDYPPVFRYMLMNVL